MANITYTGTGTGYNFESAQTIQLTHDTFPTASIVLNTISARLYFKPSRYGFNVSFTATAGGYSSTVTHFVAAGDIDGFYLDFPFDVSQSFPWRTLSSITVTCNSNAETKGYLYSRAVSQYVYVYYTVAYTKAKAPTSVSVLSNNVAPSTEVVLFWSGAQAGTSNPITGYQIYRATSLDGTWTLIETQSTQSQSGTNGSAVISPAGNYSYYYKIKTLGTVSGYDSDLSSKYAKLTSIFTDPTTPTNVTVSATTVPGANVVVSWHAASAGTNNPILGYRVQRKIDSGSWTTIATVNTTSYTFSTSVADSGQTWSFRIRTNGTYSNSSNSSTVSTNIVYPPSQPYIWSGGAGSSYNPRPIMLVIVSYNGSANSLKISADGYTASRSKNLVSGAHVRLRRKNDMSTGTEAVTVINYDSANNTASAQGTVTENTASYTDPVIVKGETTVKASHINELRTILTNIASYYSMTLHEWPSDVEAGTTELADWPIHITEIQNEIRRIADYVNNWDSSTSSQGITLPAFETPTTPKASVINQLRNAITLL